MLDKMVVHNATILRSLPNFVDPSLFLRDLCVKIRSSPLDCPMILSRVNHTNILVVTSREPMKTVKNDGTLSTANYVQCNGTLP